jgi:fatty-acid peroxygenase
VLNYWWLYKQSFLKMADIPKERTLDNSIMLMVDGFEFIPKRREKLQSKIFQTRVMLKKATCITGKEAAEIFYDPQKFCRKGVLPKRVETTLLGKGGIHGLDGDAHKQRKSMYAVAMSNDSIQDLLGYFSIYWREYQKKWSIQRKVVLFDEVSEIICQAASAWAGVPLKKEEVKKRSRDFIAMVDAFGAVGPRHWRGKKARSRTEKWIGGLIELIRENKLQVPENSPARVVASHREIGGDYLDLKTATVELINFIRPTIAITYYITFSAVALHEYPDQKKKLENGSDAEMLRFIQEVRRYYPFAPFLGAYVREDFHWNGHNFKKGEFTLLDVYGTNHDPDIWDSPHEFNPDRFFDWEGNPFNFIPQGGGNPSTGHRCPGEWITIDVARLALQYLVKHMDYKVPQQDLSFRLSRMPTMPKSRFEIVDVVSKA